MSLRQAMNRQKDFEREMRTIYGGLTKEALKDDYNLNVEGTSISELERNYEKEINSKKLYDAEAIDELYEMMRSKANLYGIKEFKSDLKSKDEKAKELIEFNPFAFYKDQNSPMVILTRKSNKDFLKKMKKKNMEMYGFSERGLFESFNDKSYLKDTDRDGILDIEEIGKGMNPYSVNSSGDRFNDKEAIALGIYARHILPEDKNRDGSILDDIPKNKDLGLELEI